MPTSTLYIKKGMIINESNFSDTFFMESKTKKIEMEKVNLTNAEFIKTNLNDIDFSSCTINETTFDEYSLKGIYVDTFQCKYLVGMLGVKVKE